MILKRRFSRLFLSLLILLATASASAAEIQIKEFPLEREGVKLFLQKMEDPSLASTGQILLVHGLTFASHEFDLDFQDYSLARYLAGRGYGVWMLDIAGYSRSGEVKDGFLPDSDYAAEDINAAVDLILKESQAPKINILGWSWGTVTSGRFASKYPDKVRKLILYAPIVAGLGRHQVTEAFKTEAWKGADEDFQRGADGQIDPAVTDPGVVKLFDENTKKYDSRPVPNGGRRDLLVSANNRLIPTAEIVNPTLLIVGDRDGYVSVKLAREAAAVIPGAELKVVEGGGHALFMEKPHYVDFRESVVEFLKK